MFPINIVEKETGFSKYLLRMWERRYSFPRPARDDKGVRVYSNQDVEKLKLVKVLMNKGYRPSKVMNQSMEELKMLMKNFMPAPMDTSDNVSVIVLTNPELLSELTDHLQNQTVKNVVMVHEMDDITNIAL